MVLVTEPRSTIILYLIDNLNGPQNSFEELGSLQILHHQFLVLSLNASNLLHFSIKLSFIFYWMSERICNLQKNKVRSSVTAIVTESLDRYNETVHLGRVKFYKFWLIKNVYGVDGGNRFKRFKMIAILDRYVLNVSIEIW